MRTARILAVVGATAVAAASLAACSSGPKDGDVTFWSPLTGDDGAFMKTLVEDFNGETDGCKVDFQPIPAGDLYTKIYSVAKSNESKPQLLLVHGPRIPEFARAGLIQPVEKLQEIQPSLVAENYIPAAWDAGVYEGVAYGIPLDLHGVVTYYNTDLLQEYGVEGWLDDDVITVDELMELEGRLPDGVYAMPGMFVPAVVEAQLYNLGSSYAPGGELDLTQPAMVEIFDGLVALNEAGLIDPEDADHYQVFNSGQAVAFPDGTWGISSRNMVDGLNWGVTHNLMIDPSNVTNVLESHTFVQMIDDRRSEKTDACVASFIEYLRVNSAYWGEAGQVVASVEAFESPEYATHPQAFLTDTEEARATLLTNDYIYAPYVSDALWGKFQDILQGRVSVEDGLQQMQDEVAAKIAESEAAAGN
ncbi:MAG: extracellular solute-binding protein [Salana multivorans]|uniref:extracellular solute-binding protein n=1 Tax=Salana multivorans TaxID=120377 RepID=UPI001AD412C8|nr:extracellular solute-binding protein [Salana multivorans]MBN8882028.1 extracellular solute-binding protein [Salana multivorans]